MQFIKNKIVITMILLVILQSCLSHPEPPEKYEHKVMASEEDGVFKFKVETYMNPKFYSIEYISLDFTQAKSDNIMMNKNYFEYDMRSYVAYHYDNNFLYFNFDVKAEHENVYDSVVILDGNIDDIKSEKESIYLNVPNNPYEMIDELKGFTITLYNKTTHKSELYFHRILFNNAK